MKLTIVIPFDEKIHEKMKLYETIASLPRQAILDVCIVTNSNIKIVDAQIIKTSFPNIFSAYNKAFCKVCSTFVLFLCPGDVLSNSFWSKISPMLDQDFNVIQFGHNRIKAENNEVYHLKRTENPIGITHNFVPKNINAVYDKIFKVELLRENNIRFQNTVNAPLIFNLKCLSLVDFFCIPDTLIDHKVQGSVGDVKTSSIVASRLLREINTDKEFLNDFINEQLEKNLDTFYKNIDFVFPYVTSDDPNWQQLYKENLKGTESDWAAGVERFRDNGMLKYVFRSLDKHMPWIRKVHLIVMSESQVPAWINRDTVDIITHEEFIPKELLPTFNSCTIDMFISKLPRVADNFIFSNDDLITFKDLKPTDFFDGTKPLYSINLRNYKATAPGDITRLNVYNLILGTDQKKRVATTQHGPIPYRKDWITECYNEYESKLINSCSKFRETTNYNQYLFALYQMFNKNIINTMKDIVSYTMKSSQMDKILNDSFSSHDFVCINDDNNADDDSWNKVLEKIDKLLPEKSKYEV